MPAKRLFLLTCAGLALAIPALAQESLLPPGFGNTASPPAAQPQPAQPAQPAQPRPSQPRPTQSLTQSEGAAGEFTEEQLADIPPPVELPGHARRDPFQVGSINPADVGL